MAKSTHTLKCFYQIKYFQKDILEIVPDELETIKIARGGLLTYRTD